MLQRRVSKKQQMRHIEGEVACGCDPQAAAPVPRKAVNYPGERGKNHQQYTAWKMHQSKQQ
jgi:hypothetical protein